MTKASDDYQALSISVAEIGRKLDMFYDEFRRVSNGTGFPRCGERLVRLDGLDDDIRVLHKRIDSINTKLWWAVTTSIVTGLGFISNIILTFVKGAMNS